MWGWVCDTPQSWIGRANHLDWQGNERFSISDIVKKITVSLPLLNVRKTFFDDIHPSPHRSPTFLGEIWTKKFLQGIIGYRRAILADTPPPPIKRGFFAPDGIVLSFTTFQILQYCITCIGLLDIDTFVFSLLSVTEEQDSWGDLLGVSWLGKKIRISS